MSECRSSLNWDKGKRSYIQIWRGKKSRGKKSRGKKSHTQLQLLKLLYDNYFISLLK